MFSDTNDFKERWMYHKDEREIEVWMQYLSQQCQYYQASEIYQQIGRIGGGKFAEVFEAKHKLSGQACAVKKIDKSKLNAKEKQFLRNELQIISMIRHPYVVEIRDVYESKRWIFISMECVKGGELFNYLD